MASGKSKMLRAIPGPQRRWITDGRTPYRKPAKDGKPSRAERKAAQLAERRAAKARARTNGKRG